MKFIVVYYNLFAFELGACLALTGDARTNTNDKHNEKVQDKNIIPNLPLPVNEEEVEEWDFGRLASFKYSQLAGNEKSEAKESDNFNIYNSNNVIKKRGDQENDSIRSLVIDGGNKNNSNNSSESVLRREDVEDVELKHDYEEYYVESTETRQTESEVASTLAEFSVTENPSSIIQAEASPTNVAKSELINVSEMPKMPPTRVAPTSAIITQSTLASIDNVKTVGTTDRTFDETSELLIEMNTAKSSAKTISSRGDGTLESDPNDSTLISPEITTVKNDMTIEGSTTTREATTTAKSLSKSKRRESDDGSSSKPTTTTMHSPPTRLELIPTTKRITIKIGRAHV